jgi:hypothetical protein
LVFTTTSTVAEVAEHPAAPTVTEYVPELVTVISAVVSPEDQLLPVAAEELNTTESPSQNVNGPFAVITGVLGFDTTVTSTAVEASELHVPSETVTVYVPVAFTVIDGVVEPSDHKYELAADEVNVTEPPAQNVVGPPAVIVGVVGNAFTVTVVPAEAAD